MRFPLTQLPSTSNFARNAGRSVGSARVYVRFTPTGQMLAALAQAKWLRPCDSVEIYFTEFAAASRLEVLMTSPQEAVSLSPRISVVIPALNEARNLPHVFARMPEGIHEVILVDGHSEDDTVAVARALWPDVRLVTQTRAGKGNALACGFAAATGDIIAMIDADGSADPAEIPRFVDALLQGADFAKGTRFMTGGDSHDITRLRAVGNKMLSILVNTLYRTNYTDLCYGYNLFWRQILPVLGLDAEPLSSSGQNVALGDGFEVETLINIRVARARLAVTEVPSIEHTRIHGVSNLNALNDGMRILHTIFKERRSRRIPEVAPASAVREVDSECQSVSVERMSN